MSWFLRSATLCLLGCVCLILPLRASVPSDVPPDFSAFWSKFFQAMEKRDTMFINAAYHSQRAAEDYYRTGGAWLTGMIYDETIAMMKKVQPVITARDIAWVSQGDPLYLPPGLMYSQPCVHVLFKQGDTEVHMVFSNTQGTYRFLGPLQIMEPEPSVVRQDSLSALTDDFSGGMIDGNFQEFLPQFLAQWNSSAPGTDTLFLSADIRSNLAGRSWSKALSAGAKLAFGMIHAAREMKWNQRFPRDYSTSQPAQLIKLLVPADGGGNHHLIFTTSNANPSKFQLAMVLEKN